MPNKIWTINKDLAANLLRDPNTSAVTLFVIAVKTVGEENMFTVDEDTGYSDSIDPLELLSELEDQFRTSIPPENENRLNALLMAFTSNLYFDDPIAFTSISMAIHSGDLGELVNGVMEDLTIEEILVAKMEIELLIEPQEFSTSVQKLIHASIKDLAEEDGEGAVVKTLDNVIEEQRAQIIRELHSIGLDDTMLKFVADYNMTI